MKVLVLGSSGMLGHTLFFELARRPEIDVWGTVRSRALVEPFFSPQQRDRLLSRIDAYHFDSILRAVGRVRPDVVINAIGVIHQLPEGQKALPCIELNARFPHRLAELCKAAGARLIHFSTDCVFDGLRGGYAESDPPTATDLYGMTKYLGEVHEPFLTLRTSIIGHELRNRLSLIEWFLSQKGDVHGYAKVLYSGLPTCEIARVIAEVVLPRPDLAGLFHVASDPISKHQLLCLVAERYGKQVRISPYTGKEENKTLDASRFRLETGYVAPSWPALIDRMYQQHHDFLAEATRA